MKSYFAYTRVSTVKQGEHGSSLQEQKGAIEAYATRHGLRIAAWFEEMETAAKLGRRTFNRMLTEIEKGPTDGVIIHKIDRSARNLRDWASLGDLIDRGIEVHFAHESLDLATRGGRLAADIQAVVASDYVRNLRQEVLKGFYGRLKQGFYPLPAPVGYLDRGKAKEKEIDPFLGPLVREAFELYGSGRHSYETLRIEMRRRGLQTRHGRPFSRNGIAHFLHNPFYIGIINIKRTGETFQGNHTPLISKALFDRVQAVMTGRFSLAKARHEFTFRRLIHCGSCNRTLTGEYQKGHAYYRCHTPACRGTSIRQEEIEAGVRSLLAALAFEDAELRDLRDLGEKARATEVSDIERRREQLTMAVAKCDDRHTRLTDAFLDGVIDKETFEHRKASILAERRGLMDAQEAGDSESSSEQLLKLFELGNTAYLQFDCQNPDEKRETLNSLCSNFVSNGKELVITPRFPFDQILKGRGVHHGGPCRDRVRTFKETVEQIAEDFQNELAVQIEVSQHPQPRKYNSGWANVEKANRERTVERACRELKAQDIPSSLLPG